MLAYVPILLDDNRFQLEGPIQAGGKWPPVLSVKPFVAEYNGYTQSYVRIIVNTKVEGDRNEGKIEVRLPIIDWNAIKYIFESLTDDNQRLEATEYYDRPFGRDKKPAKEDTLTHRIIIGAKDGRVYISLIDARDDTRPKIPFYFGAPTTRWPFANAKAAANNLAVSKAYAMGWHDTVTPVLNSLFGDMHTKALAKSKTSDRNDDSRESAPRAPSTNHTSSNMDDDLPF